MKLTLATTFIVTVLLLAACQSKAHKSEFSYGAYENGKYINKFLGITLDIPNDWYVYSEEEILKVMGLVENDVDLNDAGRENIKKNKVRSADLFMAQKYDPYEFDAIVNPSFMINVERVDDIKFIRNASDYAKLARKNMQAMTKSPVIFENEATVELGGNQFERHTIMKSEAGYDYETTQFCQIMNGYAVIFTLTYADEYDRKELIRCLSSLNYKD